MGTKGKSKDLGELDLSPGSFPILFEVDPDESDPHECGPLNVRIDRQGIAMAWTGASGQPEWQRSWKDLRAVIELLDRGFDQLREEEALREDEVALRNAKQKLKADQAEWSTRQRRISMQRHGRLVAVTKWPGTPPNNAR